MYEDEDVPTTGTLADFPISLGTDIGLSGSERLLALAMRLNAAQLPVAALELEDRATGGPRRSRASLDSLVRDFIKAIHHSDRRQLAELLAGSARTYAVKAVQLFDPPSNGRVRLDRTGRVLGTDELLSKGRVSDVADLIAEVIETE